MANEDSPPRFEVRILDKSHIEWAKAIISESNSLSSPFWTPLYESRGTNMTTTTYRLAKVADYLVGHCIDSGLSLGVFDTQYQFRHSESAASGGKLLWDETNALATPDELRAEMDFPLVSAALAFDSFAPLEPEKLKASGLFDALPEFPAILARMEALDTRDPATTKATEAGQFMGRGGTSTRTDYAGHGTMKLAAHEMMRRARDNGFRAITIDCANPAVVHVWLHPPAPFRSEIVASFNSGEYEETNDKGEITRPFAITDVDLVRVYLTLRDDK